MICFLSSKERMIGRTDGRTADGRRLDGWTDGRTGGRTDGRMDACIGSKRQRLLSNKKPVFYLAGGVRSHLPLPNKKPVFYLGEGGCSVEGALEPPPICVGSTGQPPSLK